MQAAGRQTTAPWAAQAIVLLPVQAIALQLARNCCPAPTCVDDVALGVEVVQGDQQLASDVAHSWQADAAMVIQPARGEGHTGRGRQQG
jgi:hypothetical protein